MRGAFELSLLTLGFVRVAEIKATNPDAVITSTLLRDHFGLATRGIIRRIMRQLAGERKVKISEVGGEGKRKQYIYELVA